MLNLFRKSLTVIRYTYIGNDTNVLKNGLQYKILKDFDGKLFVFKNKNNKFLEINKSFLNKNFKKTKIKDFDDSILII